MTATRKQQATVDVADHTAHPVSEIRVALRAHLQRMDKPPRNGSLRTALGFPDDVLAFDTETTTDALQRLLCGAWAHYRWAKDRTLQLGYAVLRQYARTHGLPLQSRSAFCWNIFYPIAYSARALVISFNLPFDLSRIAERWGIARGRQFGGFSLTLCTTRMKETGEPIESRWLPLIWVRINNSKQSFIEFATPFDLDGKEVDTVTEPSGHTWRTAYRGRFLDLRTFVYALTSKGTSLASAGARYGIAHPKLAAEEHGRITPQYLDYNRRDVVASIEILQAARAEFDAHPIKLDPCKAFSPAAIAKAYLHAMGVTPPRQKFTGVSVETLGIAMSAYFGGRAEARIRCMPVGVLHTDFVSMYPTCNALMDLWSYVIAADIREEDFTDGAQALLNAATVATYFDQSAWKHLTWFGLIRPDDDILPVRGAYDPNQPGLTNIGVNHFTSDQPIWYTGADLIAATLLGKKPPRIIKAVRLVPVGVQEGLKAITLPSGTVIDPARQDFFRVIIELRKRLKNDASNPGNAATAQALKILANAGSYGISAESNPEELPKGKTVPLMVHGGHAGFATESAAPESPGVFSFPPFAAWITGAARLMLALAECAVVEAGGSYGFCDTDSMAITVDKPSVELPTVTLLTTPEVAA
jgi:hypothetical protein